MSYLSKEAKESLRYFKKCHKENKTFNFKDKKTIKLGIRHLDLLINNRRYESEIVNFLGW